MYGYHSNVEVPIILLDGLEWLFRVPWLHCNDAEDSIYVSLAQKKGNVSKEGLHRGPSRLRVSLP